MGLSAPVQEQMEKTRRRSSRTPTTRGGLSEAARVPPQGSPDSRLLTSETSIWRELAHLPWPLLTLLGPQAAAGPGSGEDTPTRSIRGRRQRRRRSREVTGGGRAPTKTRAGHGQPAAGAGDEVTDGGRGGRVRNWAASLPPYMLVFSLVIGCS